MGTSTKPTRFSIGDWLSRCETMETFRDWQHTEKMKAGLVDPPIGRPTLPPTHPATQPTAQGPTASATPSPTSDERAGLSTAFDDLADSVTVEDAREKLRDTREQEILARIADAVLDKVRSDPDLATALLAPLELKAVVSELCHTVEEFGKELRDMRGVADRWGAALRADMSTLARQIDLRFAGLHAVVLGVGQKVDSTLALALPPAEGSATCPSCGEPVADSVPSCPKCSEVLEWT